MRQKGRNQKAQSQKQQGPGEQSFRGKLPNGKKRRSGEVEKQEGGEEVTAKGGNIFGLESDT
jgi:hypothetical protein